MRYSLAVAAATLCFTLPGQETRLTAIDVPAGPLVFLALTEPGQDNLVHGDLVRLALADLHGQGPACEFLRTSTLWPELRCRLDRTRLLLDLGGELTVVDVARGSSRALGKSEFVAVRGSEVLHCDGSLWASSWQVDAPPRRLSQLVVEGVEHVQGDAVLVRSEHKLWRIDLATSKAEMLVPAFESLSCARLSPSGRRLAVGLLDRSEGGRLQGRVQVFDVGHQAVVREWSGISVGLPFHSSDRARVELAWTSEDEIVCSESRNNERGEGLAFAFPGMSFVWVHRRVSDGSVLAERVYSESGLSHATPPPRPTKEPVEPWFHVVVDEDGRRTRLHRRDRTPPVGEWQRLDDPNQLAFWDWPFVEVADDGESAIVWFHEDVQLFQKGREGPRLLGCGVRAALWNTPILLFLPSAD
jgi:hypothetical protein